MNKIKISSHTLALVIGLSFASPYNIHAQDSTDSDSSEDQASYTVDESGEDVYVLPEFIVRAEDDIGYSSNRILSGTRLSTEIKDTAAAVSVMTEDFLKDIGAFTLEESFDYSVNTEVNLGATRSDPSFAFLDGALATASSPRIRGLEGTTTVDFFPTSFPTDTYNSGRFEYASGPNSILFGFGNAGGIINISTRDVFLHQPFYRPVISYGSWNYQRYQADINQPIIKDKLGIRLMGMYSDKDTWREYEFDRERRGTAVLRYDPTKKTSLRFVYEQAATNDSVSRPYPLNDKLSAVYSATGSNPSAAILDNTKFSQWGNDATKALGVGGLGPANVYVQNYDASGSRFMATGRNPSGNQGNYFPNTLLKSTGFYEPFARNQAKTLPSPVPDYWVDQLYTLFTLVPDSPDNPLSVPHMDYDTNILGPGSVRDADFKRYSVRLEHRFTESFRVELAYNHEEAEGLSITTGVGGLYYDVNQYVPKINPADSDDGNPATVDADVNPNAGSLYVDGQAWHNQEEIESDIFRLTASKDLDLTDKKMGFHRLALLLEHLERTELRQGGPQVLADANGNAILNSAVPDNFTNVFTRRHYVTPGDFSTYIIPGEIEPEGFSVDYNGTTYHTQFVNSEAATRRDKREINSLMLATQSYYFKKRLVFTGGYRLDYVNDKRNELGRISATDPRVLSGEFLANEYYPTADLLFDKDVTSRTFTTGFVYHLNEQHSLFFNASTNTGPQDLGRQILPNDETAPPKEGRGFDIGISSDFKLLGIDLNTRVNFFSVLQENNTSIRDGTILSIQNNIFDRLSEGLDDDFNNGRKLLLKNGETVNDPDNRLVHPDDLEALKIDSQDVLSDLESKGLEFEVKAKITNNFTLSANYSYTDLEQNNIYREFDGWLADQRALFDDLNAQYTGPAATDYASLYDALVSVSGAESQSIGDLLDAMETQAADIRALNEFGWNNRPHKFNIFGRYTFTDGKVKGLYFGSGLVWQSKNLVQREILGRNADGSLQMGNTLKGPEILRIDALVGYNGKFQWPGGEKKIPYNVQLNVRNVFDNDNLNVTRYNRAGTGYWRVSQAEPRYFQVSTRFFF